MMRTQKSLHALLFASLAVSACGTEEIATSTDALGETTAKVVYGSDNRLDVYASTNTSLVARAQQATVALMEPSALNTSNPNNVTFNADSLGTAYNLCSGQRFASDPTAAFCSGTLIDDDLVLTAGHCVTSAANCSNTRFVFNYYRTSATAMQTVTTADVFSCRTIVARQQATVNGRELDYAVLRLDRAATPRFVPAPVRSAAAALSANQNVAVIGCGSGIPFKIDAGGKVRDARASTLDFFSATTDTFGGNSGSGVYETDGYTVAGILVRGDTDYVQNGGCAMVNVCTESGCMGEEITYVHNAVQAYCAVATSNRLCGTPDPVDPTDPTDPVDPTDPTDPVDPTDPTDPVDPTATNYAYSAANTASATTNTSNKSITLAANETLEIGTCGVTGAAFTADTYLRLFKGTTLLGFNDDSCNGMGSYLKYTATAATTVEVHAGCYNNTSCTGTVAWKITAGGSTNPTTSFNYTASNTNNAKTNTTNKTVTLAAGQTIKLGTCTVAGAAGTGDTYLRLTNGSNSEVSSNDDSCGTLSFLSYTVPAGKGGTYTIKAGCYANQGCSGTVAYTIQ